MADHAKIDAVKEHPRHIVRYGRPSADLIALALKLDPSVFGALLRKGTPELGGEHLLSVLKQLEQDGDLQRHCGLHHRLDVHAKDEHLLTWQSYRDEHLWELMGKLELPILPGSDDGWRGFVMGKEPSSKYEQLEKLREHEPKAFAKACEACPRKLTWVYEGWLKNAEAIESGDKKKAFETVPEPIKPHILVNRLVSGSDEDDLSWAAGRLIDGLENARPGEVFFPGDSIKWGAVPAPLKEKLLIEAFEKCRVSGKTFFRQVMQQTDGKRLGSALVEAWRKYSDLTTTPDHPMAWSSDVKELGVWSIDDSRSVLARGAEYYSTLPKAHQEVLLKEHVSNNATALKGLSRDQLRGLDAHDLLLFPGSLIDGFNRLVRDAGLGDMFQGLLAEKLLAEVKQDPKKASELDWDIAFRRCEFSNNDIADIVYTIADAADSDPGEFPSLIPHKFIRDAVRRLSERSQSEIICGVIERGFTNFNYEHFFDYPPSVVEAAMDVGFLPWDMNTTNEVLILKAMDHTRSIKIPVQGISAGVLEKSFRNGVELVTDMNDCVRRRDVAGEDFQSLLGKIGGVPEVWGKSVLRAPQLFDAFLQVNAEMEIPERKKGIELLMDASTKRLYEVFDKQPDYIAEKIGAMLAQHEPGNEDLRELTNYCRASVLRDKSKAIPSPSAGPIKNATL